MGRAIIRSEIPDRSGCSQPASPDFLCDIHNETHFCSLLLDHDVVAVQILARLEKTSGRPLRNCFDLIGGTSIGGILAIGIGCGIPAGTLVELMRDHGPGIFTPKGASFGGTTASPYDPDRLRAAIESILGKSNAKRPFSEIPARLAIVAVDERISEPRVFKTEALAGEDGEKLATIDVALATSAAPTYFPPHQVGDDMFVDGGLIANAPDLILIGETIRALNARIEDIHLCSVGTASNPRVGRVDGTPGKIQWMAKHGLIDLIMDSQVALVLEQVKRLGPGTLLRLDRRPSRKIDLADVSQDTCDELLNLADQVSDDLQNTSDWRRFAAHKAG